MEQFSPSDMKTILHSKRAKMFYLEYGRVLVKAGRGEYVTDEGKQSLYWNIPIANTTCLLLGNGTSITQAAVRELAKSGVLIGFCGGGGAPLFSSNEVDFDVSFFSPQSEYRPVEYLQSWVSFWFDDDKRLEAAKQIQTLRIEYTRQQWTNNAALKEAGIEVDRVNKVREGRPHIVDAIKNGQVQLIINTTEGRKAISDSAQIRQSALQTKVTYTTTLAGGEAFCRAIKFGPERTVRRLQDLHAGK